MIRNTWDYIGSHTVDEHHFEGFEGGFPPFGWAAISNHPNNSVSHSTLYSYSGDKSVRFSSYSGPSSSDFTQYLITPKVSVPSSGGEFSFMYYAPSSWYDETFEVGVSTTDSDPASFTFGPSTTDGAMYSWSNHTEDLSSYAGQDIYVAIRYSSFYQAYLYVDHFEMPSLWVDPNPIASISPGSLDFGEVNTAVTKTLNISIQNNGGADLIADLSSNNSKFVLSSSSIVVGPGVQEVHTLTYSPTSVVKDTAIIEFVHNGASSPDTLYAYGEGTEAIFITSFESGSLPDGWAFS